MSRKGLVLIAAGGTGGHVFPALAVAQGLALQDIDVLWLGTEKGLESRVCKENSIEIFLVDVIGMRGKGLLTRLLAPFKLLAATIAVIKLIYQTKPNCVLGMGGFVSAAGGLAAFITRKPLLIQEQNAIAGTTNRYLAAMADKIFVGFPDVFKQYKQVVYTGNPLRSRFLDALVNGEQSCHHNVEHQKTLLVVGGSLGASIFNQLLPEVIAKVNAQLQSIGLPALNVMHQTGAKELSSAKARYQQNAVAANVVEFIDDMPSAYQSATVVIARSGAMTISEIAASGVASILIPYPYAIDNHQSKNADFLVEAKAAIKIEQSELSVDTLVDAVKKVILDDERGRQMADNAIQLAQLDATSKIVAACEEYVYA